MAMIGDLKRAFLLTLGFTGAMNDAEKQFWASGGNLVTQTQLTTPNADGTRWVRTKVGNYSTTADGNTNVFTFPHGVTGTPVYANVAAINATATGTRFITWNATNITVTYDVAPSPGTLTLEWVILI